MFSATYGNPNDQYGNVEYGLRGANLHIENLTATVGSVGMILPKSIGARRLATSGSVPSLSHPQIGKMLFAVTSTGGSVIKNITTSSLARVTAGSNASLAEHRFVLKMLIVTSGSVASLMRRNAHMLKTIAASTANMRRPSIAKALRATSTVVAILGKERMRILYAITGLTSARIKRAVGAKRLAVTSTAAAHVKKSAAHKMVATSLSTARLIKTLSKTLVKATAASVATLKHPAGKLLRAVTGAAVASLKHPSLARHLRAVSIASTSVVKAVGTTLVLAQAGSIARLPITRKLKLVATSVGVATLSVIQVAYSGLSKLSFVSDKIKPLYVQGRNAFKSFRP